MFARGNDAGLMPTPRDEVFRDGTAALYRFHRPASAPVAKRAPVLLVPSLINRWYVLDLRTGSSIVEALTAAGLDVFVLDWGEPNDEDRFLSWDDVVARLGRMLRRTLREAGATRAGVLGYSIGGTLSSIRAAIDPGPFAALVNLAGPIDFSHTGFLGHLTDERWFDVDTLAAAGNIRAEQMLAGFAALRPTSPVSDWMGFFERLGDRERLETFAALDRWANDSIAFPAAAYVRYVRELYRENQLVRGDHAIGGERVDLRRIDCPLLTVVTDRDSICPPEAALALGGAVSSKSPEVLRIPGGHVSAVVGDEAKTTLYPALVDFFGRHL